MTLNIISDLRHDVSRLRDLHNAGVLTPDIFRNWLSRLERRIDDIEPYVEGGPPTETIELTDLGLSAIHRGGKPARYRGHLAVIDGGRE